MKTQETYFAIRIGDPKRRSPYFRRDYVKAGLSFDNRSVRIEILDRENNGSVLYLNQEEALTLAGQIQGFAIQVMKP